MGAGRMRLILILLLCISCSSDIFEFSEACRELAENKLYRPYKVYYLFGLKDKPVCEIFYYDGMQNFDKISVHFNSKEEILGAKKLLIFKGNKD